MADPISTMIGELKGHINGMRDDVKEIKVDVKSFNKFQAQTEERLKNGVDTFKKHDIRIATVEKRKFPNKWVVYAFLTFGFALLSVLVVMR